MNLVAICAKCIRRFEYERSTRPRTLCDGCRTDRRRRDRAKLGHRNKTVNVRALKRVIRQERVAEALAERAEPVAAPAPDRPRTRGDCIDGPRPCPWVGCKYHLYIDVNPSSGSITFNAPGREPGEMAETCCLDIADRDATTLEVVGGVMNLTRERVRQIEVGALFRIRRRDKSIALLVEVMRP